MSIKLENLQIELNTCNLVKTNINLYNFLQKLLKGVAELQTEAAVEPEITGFVTTSGGTTDEIAMFTASENIEDVTATGISNALDLLP